jgi:nuclear pore complex protein Nup107
VNPYTPEQSLAQALLDRSRTLTELTAVKEWLQDTALRPPPSHAGNGYWRLTQRALEQRARAGEQGRSTGGIVEHLDPDAESREGRSIVPDDAVRTIHARRGSGFDLQEQADDRALLQALFGLVRAGQLQEAYALCMDMDQPWRAASIRGAELFTWPELCASIF